MPYGPLLRLRIACEGIAQTLPGGMVIAESLKPALLMTQCGLEASDAVCGAAARKLLLLVSQCGYFALAILIGFPSLIAVSHSPGFGRWLPSYALAAWLVLAVAASALAFVMGRGDMCRNVLGVIQRVPLRALKSLADKWHSGFAKTDVRLVEFCALGPKRLARSTALYLMAWTWEAFETTLLLTLLGVRLDFGTFCLLEVCASMIRHVAFMTPAGIGVQDAGYAILLQIFGVSNSLGVAATFTVLKRSKELFWSLIGYTLLAGMRRFESASRPSPNTTMLDSGGFATGGAQA